MATRNSLPLQERIPHKNTLDRAANLLILFLLISLLLYRLSSTQNHGKVWLVALLCESWFTFMWVLRMNCKWSPAAYTTHPERLLERFKDLPPVDLFITTADPKLEPPIITVNTALSLLAVNYPAHKLACYVSDDGGSPITFYALVEASKFAKLWVPFCKKYKVIVRAPFMYFSTGLETSQGLSSDFIYDWNMMKLKYEELSGKIEEADHAHDPHQLNKETAQFSDFERGNHPAVVKVIWKNKDNLEDEVPHLIYVSREKRPKHPHHFKAGAMNVLTRVSGVMTNAPFMLNVDCDMFANNPDVILHVMCLLLGFDKEVMSGYVQCPQQFYGGLKDDPFGNQLVVLQHHLEGGIAGIQGPFYGGSGCFHRRKIIYGLPPELQETTGKEPKEETTGKSSQELERRFGNSRELLESASKIVSGIVTEKTAVDICYRRLSSCTEAAKQVAGSTYEFDTCWGKEVGLVYGSTTEDILTGQKIHAMGWRSVFCKPDPPAFLGSVPVGGPESITQYKRWTTGLLEILVGSNTPLLVALTKRLTFRQCLAYLMIDIWALRSIPEFTYALLPAYCLLANTSFLPKVSWEPTAMAIPAAIFIVFNLYTLMEYFQCGLSVHAWWNNQRMQRIISSTAWLFGFLDVVLKILGMKETVFEITQKEQNGKDDSSSMEELGRFTFDSSVIFVPSTALMLVNLAALAIGSIKLFLVSVGGGGAASDGGPGAGEFLCSAWVVFSFLPFVRGLFGKGSYGIPWSTICKAAILCSFFMSLCIHGSQR